MLRAFTIPAFQKLWTSYSASAIATGLMPTALTVAVLERHNAATALGPVLGARTLGFVCGALPAGLIADRYRRGPVLVCASGLRALGAAGAASLRRPERAGIY